VLNNPFLSDRQVAGILNISISTVRRWRLLGHGPQWIKLGSSVRYKVEDLAEFIDSLPTGGGKAEDQ
jgi:predicted DNA-binding transcriptional regulator AlpA